jgi:hypothetical protein
MLSVFYLSCQQKLLLFLLPMDENTQREHLKAYGITFWCLEKKITKPVGLNYHLEDHFVTRCYRNTERMPDSSEL